MSTLTRRRTAAKNSASTAKSVREDRAATEKSPLLVYAFPSELGWMAVVWGKTGVRELTFQRKSKAEAIAVLKQAAVAERVDDDELPPKLARSVKLLQKYAAGESVDLSQVPVELAESTGFQERVISACRAIPAGEVLSYQQLATLAGSPRAARAVGNVMRTNIIPLLIPCHRVVGAGGSLGGYSAPSGLTMKRRLLKLEGVEV